MVLALSLNGKYFPYNYCKMALDTEKIRREVRQFLSEEGKSRSKDIADHVLSQGIGSEKTVYNEMKEMWKSGELDKTEHNRANIEYELVAVSNLVENRLAYFQTILDNIDENLGEFYADMKNPKKKMQKIERLWIIVTRMKQLQTVETLLRIIENHEPFKKSKTYLEQKKKIAEFWKRFYELIFTQPEEDFHKEVFRNFTTITYEKMIPVEKS